MNEIVNVFANKIKVGTLALTKDNRIAFQYSEEWLKNGFSINPFKLPLSSRVFISSSPYFKGLFGVFADSLPDSFGELLLDRYLRQKGIGINSLSSLERLSYVGSSGMGLLEYVPDYHERQNSEKVDFDLIQKEFNDLLSLKEVRDIENLYSLGGSSGGARPKSLIKYKGEDWIIKFPSKFDPKNIAEIEYKYMSLAKELGRYKIRVNAVAPGVTQTPMVAQMKPEVLAKEAASTYLKKLAEPKDIAQTIVFLASDQAKHITGQILRVDGGRN